MRPSRRALGWVVAAVLVLSACSGDDGDDRTEPRSTTTTTGARRSTACDGSAPAPPAGTSDHTLESGGEERRYQLDVPPSYDGTKPYPVVLALHALTVPYTVTLPTSGIADMRDDYEFIAVSPSGRLNGPTPFWMAAPTDDNYDVAFIDDLLDELERTLCIDPTQVFSHGMSNGAQMSALLACRLSDRIAAITAIDGVEFLEPCDGSPVPVLAFHGSADPVLPYTGGGLNATTIANTNYWMGDIPPDMPEPLGVDESMARWAHHNGCAKDYDEEAIGSDVRKRTWRDCDADTILYVVDGAGHQWPGRTQPAFEAQFGSGTDTIDATKLMFEFFLGRSRG